METVAIIPCAGKGERFGGQKQYVILCGKPILVHTILVFEESMVDGIVVVVNEKDVEYTKAILNGYGFSKIQGIFPGGQRRQDSVYIGLKGIGGSPDIVIVHDGVRPFVTKEIIERVVDEAKRYGGAVAAVPITDTIKFSKDGRSIERTIPRDGLWVAQTPQAFRYDLLRMALEEAKKDGFYGTDEAMLFEYLSYEVKIVMGDVENIKITTRKDLLLAESIMRIRG